jgi:hypothetical protein
MVEILSNAAGGTLNIAHICATLLVTRWGIYRDKDKLAVIKALSIAGREMETSSLYIAFHHFFKTRLVNGQQALIETVDFLLHNIYAGNCISQVSQARPRD